MRIITLFLSRLVPVFLALTILSSLLVTPVYANHNGEHMCMILEAAVRSATAKGIYYYAVIDPTRKAYRITWTNGKSFCVFEGNIQMILKTSFVITNKSRRAAVRYFVSDAIKHNAQRLPSSLAAYFLKSGDFARLIAGASGSGLISFRLVNLLMQCVIYPPKDFPGCNTVVYDF